jgi:hypothetical protein
MNEKFKDGGGGIQMRTALWQQTANETVEKPPFIETISAKHFNLPYII